MYIADDVFYGYGDSVAYSTGTPESGELVIMRMSEYDDYNYEYVDIFDESGDWIGYEENMITEEVEIEWIRTYVFEDGEIVATSLDRMGSKTTYVEDEFGEEIEEPVVEDFEESFAATVQPAAVIADGIYDLSVDGEVTIVGELPYDDDGDEDDVPVDGEVFARLYVENGRIGIAFDDEDDGFAAYGPNSAGFELANGDVVLAYENFDLFEVYDDETQDYEEIFEWWLDKFTFSVNGAIPTSGSFEFESRGMLNEAGDAFVYSESASLDVLIGDAVIEEVQLVQRWSGLPKTQRMTKSIITIRMLSLHCQVSMWPKLAWPWKKMRLSLASVFLMHRLTLILMTL